MLIILFAQKAIHLYLITKIDLSSLDESFDIGVETFLFRDFHFDQTDLFIPSQYIFSLLILIFECIKFNKVKSILFQ
jgi:hypothetical protein